MSESFDDLFNAMNLEEFVQIDGRRCKDVIETLYKPKRHADLSSFVSFRSKNQKTLRDRWPEKIDIIKPVRAAAAENGDSAGQAKMSVSRLTCFLS